MPIAKPATRPFRLQIDLAGRINPGGLRLRVGAIYRRELGAPAASGRPRPYLDAGLAIGVNPASAATSAHLEWMQLPFLVLRVQGDLNGYFGTYGALLQFPDKNAPFGADAIKALSGREQSRLGGRLLFQPTLRAKVDGIIISNQTDLAWFRFGSGGPYFYEVGYDTLLKDGDGLVANRTMILTRLWSKGADAALLAGPVYELQRTFTGGLQRQRLGGAVQYCPAHRLGPAVRPRLYMLVGVNLRDPNRARQLFMAGGVTVDFGL